MTKLIIAVGVLAVLLVAADQVAKAFVEARLADHVERREQAKDVEVDIAGFPFLTQVVQNQFDEVDVTMPRLDTPTPAGDVRVENLDVTLQNVETSDRYQRATAASVYGSGSIPYSAFDAFAPAQIGYGGLAPDGHGLLAISVPGVGSLQVEPSVADGTSLDLESLSAVSRALPPQLRPLLGRPLGLAGLPAGFTLKTVEATADGLDVTVTGSQVTVAD
jgi:hypothetical protein